MKKIVLASGSRHTIPPISSSPGIARTIHTLSENGSNHFNYYVLSKYDVSLETLEFNRTKYLHPKPSVMESVYEYLLNKLPYRIKKRVFGFTQADRIIYYYGIKKLIPIVKPDIIVTFMHFELFKLLQKEFPKAKHVYFYRSTDLMGRLGERNIEYLIKNVDGFLANTQLAIKEFNLFNISETIPTATIYNATSLASSFVGSIEKLRKKFRKKFGVGEETLVLGYAGRFSKEKSLIELLQSMVVLKEKGMIVHLFIAGDIKNERTPDFEYYNELIIFIEKHLQGQVHFFGWVPYEELYNFYASIDVGVLLSKYREGNSMFLIEALSFGKPVITTNIGGNIEIINNNENGFIINSETIVESLTKKITYLNTSRDILKSMGENAMLYIQKNHSITVLINDFNSYIKRFI